MVLAGPHFNSDDPAYLQSRAMYSRFKSAAAQQIVSSRLFSTSNAKDGELIHECLNYDGKVGDINARLDASNRAITSTQDTLAIENLRLHLRAQRRCRNGGSITPT